MKQSITIGSRASALALAQSEWVKARIVHTCPDMEVAICSIQTEGDRRLDSSLADIGGKGLFTYELEEKLRTGEIDLAVHSLKDMPYSMPEDLPILAMTERADPRDALVFPVAKTERDEELGVIGSSSPRRVLQALTLFPNAQCIPMRGNVNTRLRKLDAGECDALILAAAGLQRLGMEGRVSRVFSIQEMIPAAGQGILAVQGRKGEAGEWIKALESRQSRNAYRAENAFLCALSANCNSPVGVHAVIEGNTCYLVGVVSQNDGMPRRGEMCGNVEEAEHLGEELAGRLLHR